MLESIIDLLYKDLLFVFLSRSDPNKARLLSFQSYCFGFIKPVIYSTHDKLFLKQKSAQPQDYWIGQDEHWSIKLIYIKVFTFKENISRFYYKTGLAKTYIHVKYLLKLSRMIINSSQLYSRLCWTLGNRLSRAQSNCFWWSTDLQLCSLCTEEKGIGEQHPHVFLQKQSYVIKSTLHWHAFLKML